MTDRRARILERLDQLDALAAAALVSWDGVMALGPSPTREVGPLSRDELQHIGAWSPHAVYELVAGARQLVDEHGPDRSTLAVIDYEGADGWLAHNPADEAPCAGCGYHDPYTREPEHRHSVGDCPALSAVARMLGVTPDRTSEGTRP